MGIQKALDAHLDLIEWFPTDKGEGWADWFLSTATGSNKVTAQGLHLMLSHELGLMETVYVNRDMCDVIEAAAASMPDIPLQFDNLFWQNAFVYFERPIVHQYAVAEGDPGPLRTRAISWRQDRIGDSRYKTDNLLWGYDPKMPTQPGISHLTYIDTEDQFPDAYEVVRTHLFPYDMSGWAYGTKWITVPHGQHDTSLKVDEGLAQQRKLLLAVNLLASQYVALVSGQRATRAGLRREQRMSFTRPTFGQIQVVTLRRASQPRPPKEEGESDFEYSHRFKVRGHWRHQWYPSREEHELKWIDPFIKGPEDKPLIIKDRIWNVAR